jgi:hypothetical protein
MELLNSKGNATNVQNLASRKSKQTQTLEVILADTS